MYKACKKFLETKVTLDNEQRVSRLYCKGKKSSSSIYLQYIVLYLVSYLILSYRQESMNSRINSHLMCPKGNRKKAQANVIKHEPEAPEALLLLAMISFLSSLQLPVVSYSANYLSFVISDCFTFQRIVLHAISQTSCLAINQMAYLLSMPVCSCRGLLSPLLSFLNTRG